MENFTMDELLKAHSAAKKKMVLGIVFVAVAFFFFYLGFMLLVVQTSVGSILLILLSLPFWGVGIPFLIQGIIRTGKANRRINQLRSGAYQKPIQEPVIVAEPAPVQPVIVAEPAPVQPVIVAEPEPVVQSQPEPQPSSDTEASSTELDWQKYAPLDAGVSYNPNKNYKFHRADGFVGSVPQTFVNRTFPKCPICCSADPHWTIAQHNQMSWKGNLYLFKCDRCQGIISMSMPDVTTLGNGGSGIAANPTVGLTNLMVKGSAGKEVGAVYAVIESVGNSGVTKECEGKEFKLEQLQDMFLRK